MCSSEAEPNEKATFCRPMSEEKLSELTQQLKDLQIEERRLVHQIQQERTKINTKRRADPWKAGACIEVLNAIVKGDGSPSTHVNDTRAHITKVTGERVYFKTVNGHSMWRNKKNLHVVSGDSW